MTTNKPTFCFYDHVINLSNVVELSAILNGGAAWLYVYWGDASNETSSPLRIMRRESDLPKYFLARIVRLHEEWHKYLLQGQEPVETAKLPDTTDTPTQAENIPAHVFDISNDLEQLEAKAQSLNKLLVALEDKLGAHSMQLFNVVAAIQNMAKGNVKMAEGSQCLATRVSELDDKIESLDKLYARVAALEDKIESIDNAVSQGLKECTARIETVLQRADDDDTAELNRVLHKINCEFQRHVVDCHNAIDNYEAAINTRIRDYLDKVKYISATGMIAALACLGAAIICILLSK